MFYWKERFIKDLIVSFVPSFKHFQSSPLQTSEQSTLNYQSKSMFVYSRETRLICLIFFDSKLPKFNELKNVGAKNFFRAFQSFLFLQQTHTERFRISCSLFIWPYSHPSRTDNFWVQKQLERADQAWKTEAGGFSPRDSRWFICPCAKRSKAIIGLTWFLCSAKWGQ